MRRPIAALAILATAALLVWAFRPAPIPAETAPVTRGDLTVTVEAEGKARVREVVVVSAPIAGLLQRITLHAGDSVGAGQVVARIGSVTPSLLDSRAHAVAQATAAAAASAVELARSQLLQAEATLGFARTEADRARILFSRQALSQRMLDDANLAERTAEATAASARANLGVREKELESAQAMLDSQGDLSGDCCVEVKAPTAGTILRVATEDEQVLQPGTPIMEIGDLRDMEVTVDVLSQDAVGIAAGAAATITGWGGPDLAARVVRVEPGAFTRVSALGIEEQRVDVLLALREPAPPTLGHGFRVTAQITTDAAADVLRVPIAALFRSGADWAVYSVENGRAALRLLTIGRRNEDMAEVLTGLDEQSSVILHPADTIKAGVRIKD